MIEPQTLGRRLVVGGALAQVVGLAIDAWMHVSDPTLAAREGLLTFSNVGHVLLLGGIVLVLAGVVMSLVGARIVAAPPSVRAAILVVTALVAGAGSMAAANSSLTRSHGHGDAAAPAGGRHDHGHGAGNEPAYVELDDATRAEQAEQLTLARKVALRYPTVADAVEAGYAKVTEYVPLIGAHYMRFVSVDGTFDIEQPEMLLYDGTSPGSRMVGLSYYAVADEEPEGFAGPNDHWHRHIGLCVSNSSPLVVGTEDTTEQECAKLGGRKMDGSDGWMVHAWVVPGWDSPAGVFSAENSQLL